ncbi:hydrolase [Bacillus spongiae]|uniref:Hydrolase n=1 Tax=Bacillus spongiae TaxID=2683610 RepID=A0ABU8HB96_9BACI
MRERRFQIENEWCMVHYPEKPNGFAVMILGDFNHYVDEISSFWMQHETRKKIIEELNANGYLVCYSNLYGCHWGHEKAVRLAKRVYHYIIRNEILNDRIHILADGMGALVAEKLVPLLNEKIRSMVLYSPCISIPMHLEHEHEQKFFYKKILHELAKVYEKSVEECEREFNIADTEAYFIAKTDIPICIIQWIGSNRYKSQFHLIKDIYVERMGNSRRVELNYLVPEKNRTVSNKLILFYRKEEKIL